MSWIRLYVQYSILFFSLIIFFYFTGKLLLFAMRRFLNVAGWSIYEDIFSCLLVGCITVVTLFSLFITRGKTSNILFAFIGIALFWVLRTEHKIEQTGFVWLPKPTRKQGLELLAYASAIYTLFAVGVIKCYDWSTFLLFRQTDDWGFYSVNLQTMLLTGQENAFHVYNLLDPDYHGMMPYHYVEMWIAGLLKSLFSGLLPFYLIGLVTYPFFLFLALLGTWAFLECWIKPSKWFQRGMAFLCFFGTGWFFLNLVHQEGTLEILTSNLTINYLLLLPKRILNYACFLAALILWAKSRELPGFISLLSLAVVSIDLMPAIVGGAVLYGLVRLRNQPSSSGTLASIAIFYSLFFLLNFVLYKNFGNHNFETYSAWRVFRNELTLPPNGFLIPALFFVRGVLQVVVQYSIHILVLYYFLRSNDKPFFRAAILASSLMLLSALIAWSVLYAFFDSIQLMTGFLCLYQTVILVLGVIAVSRVKMPAMILIAGYIIIGALVNFRIFFMPEPIGKEQLPYSEKYLNEISALSPRSRVGVSLQSRSDFEKWHTRNVVTISLGGSYLPFMPQYLKSVELGIFDIPETPFRARPSGIPWIPLKLDLSAIDAYRSRILKETSVFYRYEQRIKMQQPNISLEEAQIRFIDEHRMDWLIASKDAIVGPLLKQRIVREIHDSVTGERFLLLTQGSSTARPNPVLP